jgi:hypothetical protein
MILAILAVEAAVDELVPAAHLHACLALLDDVRHGSKCAVTDTRTPEHLNDQIAATTAMFSNLPRTEPIESDNSRTPAFIKINICMNWHRRFKGNGNGNP